MTASHLHQFYRCSRSLCLAFAIAAFATSGAHAQEERVSSAGEVTARSDSSITIKDTEKKQTLTFTVTDKTEIARDREPATMQDVRVGEKALVVGRKKGNEHSAVEIILRRIQ
ncbi:MAG: hypothetical protein M3463_14555 [Verrucomicrobiota bacterium]|nr:hypothetical protein [Verrucomicrobiota bacterium]